MPLANVSEGSCSERVWWTLQDDGEPFLASYHEAKEADKTALLARLQATGAIGPSLMSQLARALDVCYWCPLNDFRTAVAVDAWGILFWPFR